MSPHDDKDEPTRSEPAPASQPPAAAFLGGPPPHLHGDPHPMANDPRFDKYRGRKRRRRPKSKPPPE